MSRMLPGRKVIVANSQDDGEADLSGGHFSGGELKIDSFKAISTHIGLGQFSWTSRDTYTLV